MLKRPVSNTGDYKNNYNNNIVTRLLMTLMMTMSRQLEELISTDSSKEDFEDQLNSGKG